MSMHANGFTGRRYWVSEPVPQEVGKTGWTRLGRAFENPPRNGRLPTITVRLEAPSTGEKLVLFEEEPKPEHDLAQ